MSNSFRPRARELLNNNSTIPLIPATASHVPFNNETRGQRCSSDVQYLCSFYRIYSAFLLLSTSVTFTSCSSFFCLRQNFFPHVHILLDFYFKLLYFWGITDSLSCYQNSLTWGSRSKLKATTTGTGASAKAQSVWTHAFQIRRITAAPPPWSPSDSAGAVAHASASLYRPSVISACWKGQAGT